MQRGDHRDQAIGDKGHVAVLQKHDPEKWVPLFRKGHAQTKNGIRVDANTPAVKSAAVRPFCRE
jgi:hypothetical protein